MYGRGVITRHGRAVKSGERVLAVTGRAACVARAGQGRS